MSGSSESLQETCLSEDERAGTDGHECTLFAGVSLLEFGKGLDELDGFSLVFDHVVYAHAAGYDQDVVFFEIFVSVSEVDVGFYGEA